MAVIGLDHVQVAIPPDSEGDCRSFYVGLLGMTEIPKPPALAARGGLWLQAGAQQLHLGVEADFRPARKAHPALLSDNLDGLAARLTEAGHAVTWDDLIEGRRRLFVSDPLGNRIELVEAGAERGKP